MALTCPYPDHSDLRHLWVWGKRIEALLNEDRDRGEYDWMIFRPTESADEAMLLYSIDYPGVVAELRSKLQAANEAFEEFKNNSDRKTDNLFSEWLWALSGCITKAAELIAEREGTKAAKTNPTSDTKSDTPKKKRSMNVAAVDCCRIFREQRQSDPTYTMKQVVSEYVATYGGSVDSIYRTINDNPDQWK